MGYLIGAIVLGMLVWAGIEIVQTIRNWEPNPSATTQKVQAEMVKETSVGQFGGDAVEGVGYAIDASHCAAESAACEAAPSAIGHVLEGLMHAVHH